MRVLREFCDSISTNVRQNSRSFAMYALFFVLIRVDTGSRSVTMVFPSIT